MSWYVSLRERKSLNLRFVPKLLLYNSIVFFYDRDELITLKTQLKRPFFPKCGIWSNFVYFRFIRSWRKQADTFPPHDWLRSLTAVTQKRTCGCWLDVCLAHVHMLVPPFRCSIGCSFLGCVSLCFSPSNTADDVRACNYISEQLGFCSRVTLSPGKTEELYSCTYTEENDYLCAKNGLSLWNSACPESGRFVVW